MRKTYQYRLYPTTGQKTKLQKSLNACRWVYNETLATRKNLWEEKQKFLSLYDTNRLLTQWKTEKSNLINAHSQCLQNAQLRVDLAFKAFFRRIKTGKKPGFPRFRSFYRYDSFTFPQSGFKIIKNKLKLSKVGSIKIRKHRNIKGTVKALIIRKNTIGKWWASFSCEIEPLLLPKVDTVVGIDVGLESFATFSNGKKIENPRFFRQEEKTLAKAQRKFSKIEKNTSVKRKRRKIIAYIYDHVSNKRKDFAHKLSHILVQTYQFIAFEKLNTKNMKENNFKGIRKSIGDVAWTQFMQFTTYKAECAGRTVVFVDPCNTSKKCSRCGQLVEKKLSTRVHSCSCGLVLDRDHNASINILSLGLQTLALSLKAT